MKNTIFKLTFILLSLIFFSYPSDISAAGYPENCAECATVGSWCAHQSGAYECTNGSYCGARYSNSNFCPDGCTCGAYYMFGAGHCDNNCIKVEWCEEPDPTATPTTIPITPVDQDDASCGTNTFPTTLEAGETRNVSLTMHNTGNTTWSRANIYHLGSQNPANNMNWGISRIEIDPSSYITPYSSYTFNFDITAPNTVGTHNNYWQMIQGGSNWFGEICGSTILVTEPCPLCANSLMSSNPSSSVVGQEISFNFSGYKQGNLHTDDDWGNGVDCEGDMDFTDNGFIIQGTKTCNAINPGTYTWTHSWATDNTNCRICSDSLNYTITDFLKIKGKIYEDLNMSPSNPTICNGNKNKLNSSMISNLSVKAIRTGYNYDDEGEGISYQGTISVDPSDYQLQYEIPIDNINLTNYNVYLTNNSDEYDCGCPKSFISKDICHYIVNRNRLGDEYDFYLTDQSSPSWWTSFGGHVYGKNKVSTTIPQLSNYTMIMRQNNINDSQGFPMSLNNEITDAIHENNSRTQAEQGQIVGTQLNVKFNNYQHFMNILLKNNQTLNPLANNNKPLSGAYLYRTGNDLSINENNNWNLESNEKSIVVFVEDNLIIDSNEPNKQVMTIDQDSEGLIIFIVKGNITFTDTVGWEDINETSPLTQAIFIADGTITFESNNDVDLKFNGTGTHVGWTDIYLNRDLKSENDNVAAHNFYFDPSFVTKFPSYLKDITLIRQEIEPVQY